MDRVTCSHCRRKYAPHQISNCGFCPDFRGCLSCYWDKHRPIHNEARGIDEMPIIVKDAGGGKDFEPAPAGVHAARCCDVRDLGMLTSTFQGKERTQHKVLVSWLIGELRQDGKPFLVSKRYTASLNEKANLRKDLASWRSKDFTEAEADGFDLEHLLGVAALLNIVHAKSPDGSKTYANVSAIMPCPKEMKPPNVPSDFVRFVDRPKEDDPGSPPSHEDHHAPPEDDSEIPF